MIDWMPMANRVNWEGKVFDHYENFTRLKRGNGTWYYQGVLK